MEPIMDEMRVRIIDTVRKLAGEKNGERLTVRDVLKELNITNRVFYNRFRNIDEVLDILYTETVQKVRQSLSIPWDGHSDFFAHVLAVGAGTLVLTYESREKYSSLIFSMDSVLEENLRWWEREIKNLIRMGQDSGNVRPDLDADAVSYGIWCFIRGFNADALARKMPIDEALAKFKTGFGALLEGFRKR
ncbi:MAG: TetR/AcrR family transcriptional regulator [Clostridia bacterium]|nr:TetR/AcrR family transcriptional regulator [Clostridia bacterium]